MVKCNDVQDRTNYFLTEFFANYDEVDIRRLKQFFKKPNTRYWRDIFDKTDYVLWIYIIIQAILIAIICFTIEFSTKTVYNSRVNHYNQADGEENWNTFNYCFSGWILAMCATGICHILGPEAQGAGISEIRCVLSGAKITDFFSFRVFITKCLGLVLSEGSGLFIGRTGDQSHVGALIAFIMLKFNCFKSIKRDSVLSVQAILLGSTVGICCMQGTPIAGFILIVEWTGKIPSLKTLWFLMVGATISSCITKYLQFTYHSKLVKHVSFPNQSEFTQLHYFAVLGLICGLYGSCYMHSFFGLQTWRQTPQAPALFKPTHRYSYVTCVIGITILSQVLIPTLMFTPRTFHNHLWGPVDLDPRLQIFDLYLPLALFILAFLKSLHLLIAASSPISGGVIGNFMVIGGLLGRAYGELLRDFCGLSDIGRFALAGAVGLSVQCMGFFWIIVYILELTANLDMTFPIFVTVLFSSMVGKYLTQPQPPGIQNIRKFEFVPQLLEIAVYEKQAQDIMAPIDFTIHHQTTFKEVVCYLQNAKQITTDYCVPVVQSNNLQKLEGIIKIENIITYMRQCLINFVKEHYDDQHLKSSHWTVQLQTFFNVYQILNFDRAYDGKDITKKQQYLLSKMKVEEAVEDIQLTNTDIEMSANINVSGDYESFLSRIIDLNDYILNFNQQPCEVQKTTKLHKIHFLFINLGVEKIWVTDNQYLVGVITRKLLNQCQ